MFVMVARFWMSAARVTALHDILPSLPVDIVEQRPFMPRLTAMGKIHPVTAELQEQKWGSWISQVDIIATPDAQILMQGDNNKPLLLLRRIDRGRVAQFTSDQIWLWARGVDGGGPYLQTLRPLIHWLLQEPGLEEESLDTVISGPHITITRRTLRHELPPLTISHAGAADISVPLTHISDGRYSAQFDAPKSGLYQLKNGDVTRDILIGGTDAPEWQRVIADTDNLKAILTQPTHGSYTRLEDNPEPHLYFNDNGVENVTSVSSQPLLSDALWLFLIGGGLMLLWWFESRQSSSI
jgi:hypothetical protein